MMILFFLPETLRSIAGNGSLRLRGIYSPLIYKITKEPKYWVEPEEAIVRPKLTAASFVEPFKLLAQRDIFASLLFGGVVYAIWSMVTASTTGLFKARFGLNDLLIGLAFLPNGMFGLPFPTPRCIDEAAGKFEGASLMLVFQASAQSSVLPSLAS
jgi:hypothetical protein